MSKMGKLRKAANDVVLFWCPGCDEAHQVIIAGDKAWGFNNDFEKPTFTPSYLTWHDPNPEANPNRIPKWEKFRVGFRCHSFITDGNIQFLEDCTHSLAGQIVELPEFKQ